MDPVLPLCVRAIAVRGLVLPKQMSIFNSSKQRAE